jgi:hypothetical protein
MAIDAQTQLSFEGMRVSRSSSAVASCSSSARPSWRNTAGARWVQKELGLEYEAIADHPDIRVVAKDLVQLAEKFRTVTQQFLPALRQRHVQTLPEIGDAVADDRRLPPA